MKHGHEEQIIKIEFVNYTNTDTYHDKEGTNQVDKTITYFLNLLHYTFVVQVHKYK